MQSPAMPQCAKNGPLLQTLLNRFRTHRRLSPNRHSSPIVLSCSPRSLNSRTASHHYPEKGKSVITEGLRPAQTRAADRGVTISLERFANHIPIAAILLLAAVLDF